MLENYANSRRTNAELYADWAGMVASFWRPSGKSDTRPLATIRIQRLLPASAPSLTAGLLTLVATPVYEPHLTKYSQMNLEQLTREFEWK